MVPLELEKELTPRKIIEKLGKKAWIWNRYYTTVN